MAKAKAKRNKVVYGPEYDFGDNLRKIRLTKGLTQQQVAEAIQVHAPTISEYESDRQKPSIMVLVDLASVYNVDMNELIGHKTTAQVKINGSYSLLTNANKKAVIDQVEYLLFKQDGNALEIINYNKKSK